MHYNRAGYRPDYHNRFCPLCPSCVLGDEFHMINVCPETSAVAVRHQVSFLALSRLCDLPSFTSLNPPDRVRVMLGNPPTSLLRKNMRTWTKHAPATCAAFSYDLLTAISEKTPPLTLDPMSWCYTR